MSRRQVGSTRRNGTFPFSGAFNSKSRSSPLLSIGLVVVGAILIIGYAFSGSGGFRGDKAVSRVEGYPGKQRAKLPELSKFGRPAKMRSSSWWIRFFVQTSLEENDAAVKKFEQAASKRSYEPSCQLFHLKSYH